MKGIRARPCLHLSKNTAAGGGPAAAAWTGNWYEGADL